MSNELNLSDRRALCFYAAQTHFPQVGVILLVVAPQQLVAPLPRAHTEPQSEVTQALEKNLTRSEAKFIQVSWKVENLPW